MAQLTAPDLSESRTPDLSTPPATEAFARLPQIDRSLIPAIPASGDAVVVRGLSKSFANTKQAKRRVLTLPFRGRRTASAQATGAGTVAKAATPIYALDNISLTVHRNEIFGILGANGSGKSTLIRVISTLLIADSGSVQVFGYDVQRDEARVKRLINRVSVEASFFKKLSPMENLLYAMRLYGRDGKNLRGEITTLLGDLGIGAARINAPLEQMSRGMQQKVAIARAFLTSPVLLLLDEPTTGLDPRSKKDVQRFVHHLRSQHDATIVICSHDMDEAEALCDRIAIMDRGSLIAVGTVSELKQLVERRSGIIDPTLEDVFIALTGHDLEDEPDPDADAAAAA